MWQRRAGRQEPGRPLRSAASPEPDRRLDDEFDAYLGGVYAEWALQNDQSVPVFAWVNRIAHASLPQLRALASRPYIAASSPDLVVWEHLVRFLAKELLTMVGDDETRMHDLQQRALIPVELRLAEGWSRAVRPIDLATSVLVALQDATHPS